MAMKYWNAFGRSAPVISALNGSAVHGVKHVGSPQRRIAAPSEGSAPRRGSWSSYALARLFRRRPAARACPLDQPPPERGEVREPSRPRASPYDRQMTSSAVAVSQSTKRIRYAAAVGCLGIFAFVCGMLDGYLQVVAPRDLWHPLEAVLPVLVTLASFCATHFTVRPNLWATLHGSIMITAILVAMFGAVPMGIFASVNILVALIPAITPGASWVWQLS